ncbi:saccharopepsin [Trifolium repens]|nr:saccharopepsin [Trifolium repens]
MTLLLIQMIIVHSLKNEDEDVRLSLELVHRHNSRFVDVVDQVEAIKGFYKRDLLRRERMNEIMRRKRQGYNRRKDIEMMKPQFQLPILSGRDEKLGEYFVDVEVGTPGQSFWVIADTGSELTWFNSMKKVHKSNHGGHKHRRSKTKRRARTRTKSRTGTSKRKRRVGSNNPCHGVFCPHNSNTFQQVSCSSKVCKEDLSAVFSLAYCPNPSDPCLYDISYADGSSAAGFFGTDTITVNLTNGRKGKLQNLTIGCTQSMANGVTFNEDTGGILGLGLAKDSFVEKAGLQYGAKFSYCLVDHLSHKDVSSYLTFGTPKEKLLTEMKRTELLIYPPFYGVNVIGVSVADQMLNIPPNVWNFEAEGGMILDSGTSLATLVLEAYYPIVGALEKSLNNVRRVDKSAAILDFCFDSEGFDESSVPRLAFHFAGGARFEPPVKSYIIDVGPMVKCIGFVPINGTGASVIGNILQQNHLWEFDLAHNTLGFAPSKCN